MLKKIIMAATMAAAVAAFVAPAAQAEIPAVFQHEGGNLEETGSVTGSGQLGFEQENGGITCNAHGTVDLTATQGVAHVTTLDLSSCHAFGGLGFLCTVQATTVKSLPTLDATTDADETGTLVSTGLKVHNTLSGFFCPTKTIEVTGGQPTLEADDAEAATEFAAGGKVTTTLGEADAFGALVLTTNAGTYGIS